MAIAADEIFFKVTKLQRILIVAAVCILLLVGFYFLVIADIQASISALEKADRSDKNRHRESGKNTRRRSETEGQDSRAGAKASTMVASLPESRILNNC